MGSNVWTHLAISINLDGAVDATHEGEGAVETCPSSTQWGCP